MSSLLSMLTQPRLAHESGGGTPAGYPHATGNGSSADLARAASALQSALDSEKDPEDKAEIAKLLAACHKIEADRQKEGDSAMGLSSQHKFIRRSKQNQGAY